MSAEEEDLDPAMKAYLRGLAEGEAHGRKMAWSEAICDIAEFVSKALPTLAGCTLAIAIMMMEPRKTK